MFASLAESFYKTFIADNRWQLVAGGLGVTLVISVCAGILGVLLGYGTVLARRSDMRWLIRLVDGYCSLMRGIPLVVVLMVLYYVVFGSAEISGEVVAVLAFALAFGSTTGSIMWSAVESIDVLQEESALAMGYSRAQAFRKIVFPQAKPLILPQLIAQFVSLVKNTSVVGYIAVVDLTRASDLIRSRTMDAFFPLVSTALIYFVLCKFIAWALVKLAEKLGTVDRPREVEGTTG